MSSKPEPEINTISDKEWGQMKDRAAARNLDVSPRRPIGGGKLGAQGYKRRHEN